MKNISDRVAKLLVDGHIIKETDKDKCSYGIDIMLASLSQILCILVISVFAKNFLETLLFFLAFVPLRIYAGGYHAETRLRCFMVLAGVYLAFSIFIKYDNVLLYTLILYGGMAFSLIMVLAAAPVLHSRKHLTKNEICVFRRIAIMICCLEIIIILLFSIIVGQNVFTVSCASGQLAVSLSMTAACIKNHLRGGVKGEEAL